MLLYYGLRVPEYRLCGYVGSLQTKSSKRKQKALHSWHMIFRQLGKGGRRQANAHSLERGCRCDAVAAAFSTLPSLGKAFLDRRLPLIPHTCTKPNAEGQFRMPVLGLGTAGLEGEGNIDGTLSNVVCAAVGEGIRLYDTAQNYGSEVGLGDGLQLGMKQHNVPREHIYISGKVDLNSQEDPKMRMRRQVENSLQNLQTPYLDSMIFHWPICLDKHDADHQTVRKETWQALEGLVDEGLVRSIGCSNWTCDLLDELLTL